MMKILMAWLHVSSEIVSNFLKNSVFYLNLSFLLSKQT